MPRLGGWRASAALATEGTYKVSVSLPRLGGWRELTHGPGRPGPYCFSLVAEIGWLASLLERVRRGPQKSVSVSLPRLGGWRASQLCELERQQYPFQSRCRDWVVGESSSWSKTGRSSGLFQSRCRDWVVGEARIPSAKTEGRYVSVSLPRLGGWRVALHSLRNVVLVVSVSLPRLGGWRACVQNLTSTDNP